MKPAGVAQLPSALALFCLIPLSDALAQDAYTFERIAKAQPDECFQGVGNPLNREDPILGFDVNFPEDLDETQKQACLAIMPDPQFPSAAEPASAVSRTGVGNLANYGIRTMAVVGDAPYLGSANPMSLMTDPDDAWPEGGWELIRLVVGQ